jgi:hypothetical protein
VAESAAADRTDGSARPVLASKCPAIQRKIAPCGVDVITAADAVRAIGTANCDDGAGSGGGGCDDDGDGTGSSARCGSVGLKSAVVEGVAVHGRR